MIVQPLGPHRWHLLLASLVTTVTLGACTLLADFPDFDADVPCGNGVLDPGEACDGSDLNGQTCAVGDPNPNGITCTNTCEIDRSGCGDFCGDGIQQAPSETCDGSDFGGTGCSDHVPSSTGGTLACTDSCQVDVTDCIVCGNNILDPGEECDTANNNGETCDSLGAGTGGELRCSNACQFDVSNCGTCPDGLCQLERGETATSCADCAFTRVAGGAISTCALRGPGQPWCWGYGEAVGPGLDEPYPTPLPDSPLFEELVAGREHFCGRTTAGDVYCWGVGFLGQLGNGATDAHTTPVPVDLGAAQAIALGAGHDHTCAVIDDGSVFCWGDNIEGCLGSDQGTAISSSPVPLPVVGIANATAVAGGFNHTCAVLTTSEIACWGHGNAGELGDGLGVSSLTPVSVAMINDAIAVSAGQFFTCALSSAGPVHCWGDNAYGQLGIGTTDGTNLPTPLVSQLMGMVRIESGFRHTCAVGQNDSAYCWGDSAAGKLGRRATMPLCDDVLSGTLIDGVYVSGGTWLSPIVRVTAGEAHSCALNSDGLVYCWGLDSGGLLGMGPSTGGCVSEARLVANQ